MKLFGNKKISAPAKNEKNASADLLIEEQQQPEEESRLQPRTRAICLMLGAICLFAGVVAMCFTLINQSAEVQALPMEEPKAIEYLVNVLPPATEDVPIEFDAPKSVYNSNRLNFLLIGIDDATDLTNMIMLASVDLHSKDVALISIPRETYISGKFKNPSLYNVYKESEGGEHGVRAVIEKVQEMIGFWPDYYFVFNTKSLNGLLDLTGDIDFDVPADPAFSNLSSGSQSINGDKAVKLLNYNNDFKTITTEPARVQRSFIQTLLTVLLQESEHIEENARAIAAFANTDLSSDDLAFLGHFLRGMDMNAIYSRAFTGEVIEADGSSFFQVDPIAAAEMLNECFNPMEEDLTVFDLNFRQLTGASGVGTYDAYGFGNGWNNTGNTANNDDTNQTESHEPSDEPEETSATEETQATEPTGTQEVTEPIVTDPPEPDPEPETP